MSMASRRKRTSRLDVKFTFRVTPEDLEKLERVRKAMGWSKSELVRWMIDQAMGRIEVPSAIVMEIPENASALRIYKKLNKVVIEFV